MIDDTIRYVRVDGILYKVYVGSKSGEEHWEALSKTRDYYNEDIDEFEDRYYDN